MALTTEQKIWAELRKTAKRMGAEHPDLVAAQFALESGWGKHTSGKNNYFGQKAISNGTEALTKEEEGGVLVDKVEMFMDFESKEESVRYLVDRWHKDYKTYKGVNRAKDAYEAAKLLVFEGYATDSKYVEKITGLLDRYAVVDSKKVEEVVITKWVADQDTWLKKGTEQATTYSEDKKVDIKKGKVLQFTRLVEVPSSAHVKVQLAYGAGEWFIFEPHFTKYVTNNPKPGLVVAEPEIDWSDFDFKVTPVLTVGEILQYDNRRRPATNSADIARILRTAEEFTKVRRAWGRPLGVTSFYRPEPINREVGGVYGSYHVTGEAMDIYPAGMPIEAFWAWISVRWRGGLGDGRNRGFIHLDTAGGGFVPGAGARPRRTWRY